MKMNMCLRVSLVFIVIMMILSGMPSGTVTEDAEAQVAPDVSVELTDSILEVDVSPSGTGIAQSTIILRNEGVHQVSVIVTVVIDGYLASPSQLTVSLGPLASRNIPMAIAANFRSPYQIKSGYVNASVKSVDYVPVEGLFLNNIGFQVRTIAYARLVLDAEDPLLKIWPGKTTKLKFNVLNDGNIDDEIRLEVGNKEELYKAGFSIALESSGSVLITPKEMIRMNIHITTPKKVWEDRYYTVDVRAISDFETNQRFDYSVTIWVRGVYIPGFDPIPALISLFVVAAFLNRKKEK